MSVIVFRIYRSNLYRVCNLLEKGKIKLYAQILSYLHCMHIIQLLITV